MKNIIFTEEQLQNLNEIGILKRPQISWLRIIFYFLIPAVVLTVLFIVLKYFAVSATMTIILVLTVFTVYVILTLKRATICAVKIYQRYAPDSVRNKCRFEPSCSEYMILSIEKYGLLKGVRKGIHRLKRCNVNGGGFDYP